MSCAFASSGVGGRVFSSPIFNILVGCNITSYDSVFSIRLTMFALEVLMKNLGCLGKTTID